jgi:hypothetical protein
MSNKNGCTGSGFGMSYAKRKADMPDLPITFVKLWAKMQM